MGRPFINNYSYQEYGGGPVNWWEIEDEKGNMYFANGAGVLQFDGVNWKLIPVDNNGARCLVKDENGVIHVGGIGNFGYLKPDSSDSMQFVSLLDKVSKEDRDFRDVWEVDYYKGRVIFRTEFKLYCWDGKKMDIIEAK